MTELSLLFCGDFAPVRRFESVILRDGSAIFGDLLPEISSADISCLNLEAPLSERGTPIGKDGIPGKPGLRAHPDCIRAIADAGFSVAGLANNHAMDYGHIALADNIRQCKQYGVATVGAGPDLAAAQQPWIIESKGLKVAIIAVAEHQFGMAGTTTAGVDAVICHHSHVPGAHEMYRGKPIVYSLGNLVFDHEIPPSGWCEGYALRLRYAVSDHNLLSTELIPYTQTLAQGGIRKIQGAQLRVFLKARKDATEILNDPTAYQSRWEAFCRSKAALISLRNYSPFWSKALTWLNKIIPIHKWLLSRSTVNIKANIVRCQSHREVLVEVLGNKTREIAP